MNDFARIFHGLKKTFYADLVAVVIGGAIGSVIGILFALSIGYPVKFGFYIGVMPGIVLALLISSFSKSRFDFSDPSDD